MVPHIGLDAEPNAVDGDNTGNQPASRTKIFRVKTKQKLQEDLDLRYRCRHERTFPALQEMRY